MATEKTTDFKKVVIEKFTRVRYERYQQKGVPFRVFCDWKDMEFTVKMMDCGRDNKQILCEYTMYNEYSKKYETHSSFFDEKGKDWNSQLYIVQGLEGIEKGDFIIEKSQADADFFFYQLFDGFCQCEKNVGFGTHWSCDCYGGQINLSRIFNPTTGYLKHDYYVRKATEEEVEQFYKHMLAGGYGYDKEEECLYDVPKVGQPYWSVEQGKDGSMIVVPHEPPTCEEERTFDCINVFTYQDSAQERADKINQILLLGKIK